MIAWVAARNDAPNYGTVRAYRFPADTTIFGPAQIEARIDQDPTISAQVTLWNQSGSRSSAATCIVVPVGDALIYLQPVYLQSTSSAFPEFQRIVVACPSTVVWGGRCARPSAAPDRAGRRPPAASPRPPPTPGRPRPPGPSADADGRPRRRAAGCRPTSPGWSTTRTRTSSWPRPRSANGDFATYGTEMDLVEAALQALGGLTGSPAPSLGP